MAVIHKALADPTRLRIVARLAEGDGTVSDHVSGMMWQRHHSAAMRFVEADGYCDTLALGGHTDWRLPNIDELRTLLRGNPNSETDGDCPVHEGSPKEDMTDPACVQAPDYEGPGSGGC